MKRIDVYINILKHILSLCTGLSEEDKDSLEYSIANDPLGTIDYDKIKTHLAPVHDGCVRLMDKIKTLVIDSTSDLVNPGCNTYVFVKKSDIKKEYKFHLETPGLICLDASKLFTPSLGDEVLSAIEHACSVDGRIPDFISKLDDNSNSEGALIIFDPAVHTDFGNNPQRDYSYSVLQYLYTSKKFGLDANLDPVSFPIESLTYDKNTEYCQYIDIYDIINDWNHAENLLDSFLRMYHIIEYMAYRKDMVKIAQGATIKKSFLRQIKNLDKAYQSSERSKIVSGYCTLFQSARLSDADLIGDRRDITFCRDYFPKENGTEYFTAANLNPANATKQLKTTAMFIYDVRCMIVHSKESEFHITLTNYDEYSAIVPLMRKIIERVRAELKIILGNNANGIRFTDPTMPLY